MRPAVVRPLPYSAFPAIRIAVGTLDRSIAAARSTVRVSGRGGLGNAGMVAIEPPSLQLTSAGTISVAIWPGAVRAATTASAASRPISEEARQVRNHLEYGRAMPSMFELRGGSYCR